MRQYCFSNDAYGDTEILEENGELHLIQLFGLEMEVRDFQPPRVVGLQDVYTSLGDCAFSQKVKSVVQTKDQIEIVLDLYGGKMKYVIHMEHIPQLGIIRRKDTLLNLSDKCIYLMKVKQRFNFSDDKYEIFFQKSEWGTENCGAWYPLTPAGVTLGCICGRTCESHTPMLAIQNRYGHGVCVHLIPKGNWEMNMRLHSRQNVGQEYQYLLETGDSSEHFYYPLEAGATYEAPELWLMSMSKGLLGMQAITNILTFEGDSEQVHAMLDKIKSDELGFGSIDFNKIIPMPESLNIEAGSRTDDALYVCMMALNPAAPDMGVPKLSSEEYQKLAGIVGRSKGEQFMTLDAQRISRASKYTPLSDVIAMGQVVISNFLQYGCGDWYGWCNRNWGTKWNAYDVHFDQESQSIHFLTAWDTPTPVIDKLSQMFPEVEVDLQWADEDIGHNVGHVVLLAGEPINGNIPEGGSREAYEMAFQIHGAEAADFNMVFDEKKDTYVYQEPEKRTPPQTKGDKPKEPER